LENDCNDDGTPISCCDSKLIPGGTFPMGANEGFHEQVPEHDATVADFFLDTFEVTVGRFRRFVDAYDEGWRPTEGDGAHPLITNSGWRKAWDEELPADRAKLLSQITEGPKHVTWTDTAGESERKPINYMTWYVAFAFCIWDKGRLPTEAEWEYAAAGGSRNRTYPWGGHGGGIGLGEAGYFLCTSDWVAQGGCPPREVGAYPYGKGLWGHNDLPGNLHEWVLDCYDKDWYRGDGNPCDNCANLKRSCDRVQRGGGWDLVSVTGLDVAYRYHEDASSSGAYRGVRCARNP
jgi:formylglycine-generating enzyme required for sulfatase activity